MRRSLVYLELGIFSSALVISAVSVYLFHDVDREMVERWNEAFAGLCFEFFLFTSFIVLGVGILTWLGRRLFNLKGSSPRASLGLVLGICVSVVQYPWEFVGRILLPQLEDTSLILYIVLAIIVCTGILLRDNYRQAQTTQAVDIPQSPV